MAALGSSVAAIAERSGFSASALRYYQGIGLIVLPTRTDAGYRLYDESTLARLAFIGRAKQLGCSQEEITDLVERLEVATRDERAPLLCEVTSRRRASGTRPSCTRGPIPRPGGPAIAGTRPARDGATQRSSNELVGQLHDGSYRRPERITVREYLDERWLPMKRSQLRASTWHSYEQMIRLHVVPALGARQLQQLTAHDLDALYAELLASGRARGKGGLSVKTVHYIHTIISKALADAERKGTITREVATLADRPKFSASRRREMRISTGEQLRQFLDVAEDHHLHAAWFLAAHTGMRRGEVLRLR